jgi:hypothetical protein
VNLERVANFSSQAHCAVLVTPLASSVQYSKASFLSSIKVVHAYMDDEILCDPMCSEN